MRIPWFPTFVDKYTSKHQSLNGSTLVFDGQNYFYQMYQRSGLQFIFGCESNKYYDFLKEHLSMFKIANVTCYFIFKGGHKSMQRAEKHKELDRKFQVGQPLDPRDLNPPPIFIWEIHRQVLEEMGFYYTFCEYEVKTACIALAQKLQYLIVSYDIEFCMSGVPYVPHKTLRFNKKTQKLTASIFKLNHFLNELGIDEDKLSTFVVLMDENIFPENYFMKLLIFLRLPLQCSKKLEKYEMIFKWLKGTNTDEALKTIFAYVSSEDQVKFLEAKKQVMNMIRRQETSSLPLQYLENGCRIEITEHDPLWFEKGVVSGRIALAYVDLYRHSTTFGSFAIANDESEEPLLLSSEIIKYTYNLLTNFQREMFVIKPPQGEDILVETTGIVKPEYEAKDSMFENGWDRIQSLGLFDHFLMQTIPGFKDLRLDEVPEDAKLLMIALWYFKRYSSDDHTDSIVGSVILSYVSLGVVEETRPNDNDTDNIKAAVTDIDKKEVKHLVSEYNSAMKYSAACQIFEPTLIHPFVEFQHCLAHLCYLNKLCGSPYRPIVFSKMFNGTFIYRVLYTMVRESADDPFGFLSQMLSSAPTVLAFLEGLLTIYREVD